ncbi:MAG: AMP-binding protein [Planctomycetes bacterium]|nr:AMP-binding protein [Planctomycetota bacterium]MCB9910916.1 AMP-binding protein [Planctomycetota bacterium]MCB9912127.1 AMP-binding protein [Planctomycetota bacterium]
MSLWKLLEEGVAQDPSAPAIASGEPALSYAELRARIVRLARELTLLGVEVGDRVAILAGNGCPFLEAYFACAGLGAILVPLGTRLAPAEWRMLLIHSEAKWLLVGDGWTDAAKRIPLPDTTRIADLRSGAGPRLQPWGQTPPALPASNRWIARDVSAETVAQIYYTSGTTGDPKGVMLTHGNVTQHARWAIDEFALGAGDTWGHFAPMFHLADAWATFAATAVGAQHAFLAQFEAQAALDRIQSAGVTLTNLVPTMLQRMLALAPPSAKTRLRLVLSGGAPIAPAVVARVLDFFGCDYAQTYGLTETSPYLTLSLPGPGEAPFAAEERLERISRTGRAFGGVGLQVVDETGLPVAQDDRTVGEIWAQGPTVTPGYWNHPEATRAAFEGAWLRTGDLATWDARGSLRIVDRKKDVILSGGETVYSTEVEAALLAHPDVLEAAAYGVPSEAWGEEVRAAVVWKPGAPGDPAALNGFLRERLAGFKCPKVLSILDELPKTSSGKIKKRDLRQG